MKKLFFFLIINFIFKYIKADCSFNIYDSINSPIFMQKIGNELLWLRVTEPTIIFTEFSEIIAYCPSGFQNLQTRRRDYDSYGYNSDYVDYTKNTVVLKCVDGRKKIKYDNYFEDFDKLNCHTLANSEIYEVSSNIYEIPCNKNYYSVGFNVQGLPIVFANICFDLDNMRLNYIHYVAKAVTPVLKDQVNLNLSVKTEAPAESFFIDEPSAHKLIKNLIGNQVDFIKFNYEEFYPSDNWMPYISTPLETAKTFNRFLGWTSLMQGNWKSFKNLLKLRSKKVTYDVYLGTSDVILAPTLDECKSFKKLDLEEYSKSVSVPKYVWAYLKSKENRTDEFVVIGVNSPYFEFFPRNETIFCDDICNEIDWFAPLEMFRKISTFGYMFCCRKEQVEKYLDGFPIFNINKINKTLSDSELNIRMETKINLE